MAVKGRDLQGEGEISIWVKVPRNSDSQNEGTQVKKGKVRAMGEKDQKPR